MKIISIESITVSDNLNHDPRVVPLPRVSFDGVLSHEQHKDWLLAFSDPDEFNEVHNQEPDDT